MGKSKRGIWPILLFMGMAVGLNAVSGQTKYFKLGGELELKPGSPPGSGTSITWKFQSNKVIEYDPNFSHESDAYGDFKNRATLDTTTGQLKMTGLFKRDSGVYTMEVNSELKETYTVAVISSVGKPKISLTTEDNRPCDMKLGSCRLTCEADTTDAGPVTHSWRVGTEGPWNNSSDKHLKIYSTHVGEKIFCRIMNPLGDEYSEYYHILPESFHEKQPLLTAFLVILFLACPLVIIVVCILSLFIPRLKTEREKLFKRLRRTNTDPKNAASNSEAPPATGEPLLHTNTTEGGVRSNGNSN